jgi:hypothetical protein
VKYQIRRLDGMWRLSVVARDGWCAATYWLFDSWQHAVDFMSEGNAWVWL